MGEKLVLAIDVGTQSLRGFLVSPRGDIVDMEQKKYEKAYFSPKPGWAEQTPDFYYEVLCGVSKALLARNQDKLGDILALSIASIRDTWLCLDENNQPLRNIIVWLDNREVEEDKPFSAPMRLALKVSNKRKVVQKFYRLSHCNWVARYEPEIWKKTAKYASLPAYLHYKLTGVLKDAVSNAVGHLPFDSKNRRWMKKTDLRRIIFNVKSSQLVDLVESGGEIGLITKTVARKTGIPEGMPLVAGGADKACETLGLSAIKPNQAAIAVGTIATLQFSLPAYYEVGMGVPAMPAVVSTMFNTEVSIYRGFWMISWFKKEFAQKECAEAERLGVSPESLLNKRLSEVPAGSDGLILQPYWRASDSAPNGMGSIIGFSDVHTRLHIYRAIIEGIGFALMDGMYAVEKLASQKIDELFVAGGGSQSDEVCQIISNMFGLPVKRIQTHEACGLGAAMPAFVAKGVFKDYDEATASMVHISSTLLPDLEETQLYAKLYRDIFRNIYPRLEPLYIKLRAILVKGD